MIWQFSNQISLKCFHFSWLRLNTFVASMSTIRNLSAKFNQIPLKKPTNLSSKVSFRVEFNCLLNNHSQFIWCYKFTSISRLSPLFKPSKQKLKGCISNSHEFISILDSGSIFPTFYFINVLCLTALTNSFTSGCRDRTYLYNTKSTSLLFCVQQKGFWSFILELCEFVWDYYSTLQSFLLSYSVYFSLCLPFNIIFYWFQFLGCASYGF